MERSISRSVVLAVGVALAALIQWLLLIDRARHAATLWWKVGNGQLTAGATTLTIFVVGSLALAAIGWHTGTVVSAPRRRGAQPF